MPPIKLSEVTYPSEIGSDVVNRSVRVRSLPLIASSPGSATQSMVVNPSERVSTNYPSQLYHQQLLEGFEEWYVQTLYPKFIAVEDAWRTWGRVCKEMADISYDENPRPNIPSLAPFSKCRTCDHSIDMCLQKVLTDAEKQIVKAAVEIVENTKEEQRLYIATRKITDDGEKRQWTLYMNDNLVIGRGQAEDMDEILCAEFFAKQRRLLQSSSYYPGRQVD